MQFGTVQSVFLCNKKEITNIVVVIFQNIHFETVDNWMADDGKLLSAYDRAFLHGSQ